MFLRKAWRLAIDNSALDFQLPQRFKAEYIGKDGNKHRPKQAKVPFMLIIGGKEAETDSVSVRRRDDGDLGSMTVVIFCSD